MDRTMDPWHESTSHPAANTARIRALAERASAAQLGREDVIDHLKARIARDENYLRRRRERGRRTAYDELLEGDLMALALVVEWLQGARDADG